MAFLHFPNNPDLEITTRFFLENSRHILCTWGMVINDSEVAQRQSMEQCNSQLYQLDSI